MNNRENTTVKKDSIYEEFVLWTAMPPSERHKLGIETQQQFSEYYGISINTPTAWKRRADFPGRVSALRKEWAFEKTSMVIEAILRSAAKGSSASQKLWLQYFHNFPKEQERAAKEKGAILHHNDLRTLLDAFPPDLQIKYYGYLREILDMAVQLKDKGLLIDGPIPEVDYDKSPTDESELQALKEAEAAIPEKIRQFDSIPIEERSMADIERRGI